MLLRNATKPRSLCLVRPLSLGVVLRAAQPPPLTKTVSEEFANHHRLHEQKLTLASQMAMEAKLQRVERLKAAFFGLLALGGIIVAYDVYLKYPEYKHTALVALGLEEKPRPAVKNGALKAAKRAAAEVPVVVNPLPSLVPGLYAWGDNSDGLFGEGDLEVETLAVRYPLRVKFFDHMSLRDVVLARRSNVAVDERGDVYQWGTTYGSSAPLKVLKGCNVKKVVISNGVLYCLRGNGEVVYMPELREAQTAFVSHTYRYRWALLKREMPFRALEGRFQDIVAGKSHLVALSTEGKVYTMSTGLDSMDLANRTNKGQFGLPTLSQFDPLPPPNRLHEVTLLNNMRQKNRVQRRQTVQIAAGNNHTLALDEFGDVWSWGLNTYGQLGHTVNYNSEIIPVPKKVVLKGHFGTGMYPVATDILAGGNYSVTKYQARDTNRFYQQSRLGGVQDDESTDHYFAFGNGINGTLGIGKYVHSQADPARIQTLSNMTEYSESEQAVVSVPVLRWSAGLNHVIATVHNALNGACDNDVLVWGGNAHGQLGNGKKTQACKPVAIPSLLEPAGEGSVIQRGVADVARIQKTRLQIGKRGKGEQVVVAGDQKSALFYRK